MSDPYAEILEGNAVQRAAPGPRHEQICDRLHDCIRASVAKLATTRLLPRRSEVDVAPFCLLRPDLALVTVATGKLWLAAEIISSDDHQADTVLKKDIYEALKVPRLWMIDPRYDNVEIYHASAYGLTLKGILAGREVLSEKLLPEFQIVVSELFAASNSGS